MKIDLANTPIPSADIDPSQWLWNEETGIEQIVSDLFAFFFWKIVEDMKLDIEERRHKGEQVADLNLNDNVTRVRIMAQAYNKATIQARRMSERMGRAFIALAYKVKSSGSHYAEEAETVYEMIAQKMMDMDPLETHLNELTFLVDEFFPTMEQLGENVDEWLSVKAAGGITKAMAIVPELRRQLKIYVNAGAEEDRKIEVLKKDLEKDLPKEEKARKTVELGLLQEKRAATVEEAASRLAAVYHEALSVVTDKSLQAWGPGRQGVKGVLAEKISAINQGKGADVVKYDGSFVRRDGDKDTLLVVVMPNYLADMFIAHTAGYATWTLRGSKHIRKIIEKRFGKE